MRGEEEMCAAGGRGQEETRSSSNKKTNKKIQNKYDYDDMGDVEASEARHFLYSRWPAAPGLLGKKAKVKPH